MSNTMLCARTKLARTVQILTLSAGVMMLSSPAIAMESPSMTSTTVHASETLSNPQQAILPIAAFAAVGDLPNLHTALNQGLDAGLTVSDTKEILIQLCAYAGFPRSLNALTTLMKVLDERKQKGIVDAAGTEPSHPIPKGGALLAAGTANQTKLSGAPVVGPVFDFAPIANEYLRTHLFGYIFERDNFDWQSRELATLGMLSALSGVGPQLQAHMRISRNTGLSLNQLQHVIQVLKDRVSDESAQRAEEALKGYIETTAKS